MFSLKCESAEGRLPENFCNKINNHFVALLVITVCVSVIRERPSLHINAGPPVCEGGCWPARLRGGIMLMGEHNPKTSYLKVTINCGY